MTTYGERPGVYIDYDASAVVSSTAASGSVTLLCELSGSDAVKSFYSLRAALADREVAAAPDLQKVLTAAFESGARAVFLLPAAEDTAAAFTAAMETAESLNAAEVLVLCSMNTEVQAAFVDFLNAGAEKGRPQIGFTYCADEGAARKRAAACNCERLVITAQGGAVNAAALAAAVAVAPVSDPLYGLELGGAARPISRLSEAAVDAMIAGGVTPLEAVGGKIYSIRTVSTRTATGGVADRSFLDLQTVRIVDRVLDGVRASLSRMLGAARNSSRSRLAIGTQTSIVLAQCRQEELLSDYDSPVVEADAEDPAACRVLLSFTVARGISRIHISATVTV